MDAKASKKAALKTEDGFFRDFILSSLNDFNKNTVLHGLKYLTNQKLYLLERFYFSLAIALAVSCTAYFSLDIMQRSGRNPVLLSPDADPNFVMDEPFPALTICNLNSAYKSKAEKLSRNTIRRSVLDLLCRRETNDSVLMSRANYTLVRDLVMEVAQPCDKLLLYCQFGGIRHNCSQLFHPIITDEGLCCSFNLLHPGYIFKKRLAASKRVSNLEVENDFQVPWSLEDGYPEQLPKGFSPRKTPGIGETLGMYLVLNVEADQYYCSSMNSMGFKMLLHSPTELPNLRETGLPLPPGKEIKMRISVIKYESQPELRNLDKRHRKCLFEDEQVLEFHRKYTQRNCRLECALNLTKEQCGCAPHYMPQIDSGLPVCTLKQAQCVEHARFGNSKFFANTSMNCEADCVSSCFNINYMPDISWAKIKASALLPFNSTLDAASREYVEKNIGVLRLFFDRPSYRGFMQAEFVSRTSLVAKIGALIGVFIGFDFLVIAELIFFLFIRPCRRLLQLFCLKDKVSSLNECPALTRKAWQKPIRKNYDRNFALWRERARARATARAKHSEPGIHHANRFRHYVMMRHQMALASLEGRQAPFTID